MSPATMAKDAVPSVAPSVALVIVGGFGVPAVGVAVAALLSGPTTVDVNGRIVNEYWTPPVNPVIAHGVVTLHVTVTPVPPPIGSATSL